MCCANYLASSCKTREICEIVLRCGLTLVIPVIRGGNMDVRCLLVLLIPGVWCGTAASPVNLDDHVTPGEVFCVLAHFDDWEGSPYFYPFPGNVSDQEGYPEVKAHVVEYNITSMDPCKFQIVYHPNHKYAKVSIGARPNKATKFLRDLTFFRNNIDVSKSGYACKSSPCKGPIDVTESNPYTFTSYESLGTVSRDSGVYQYESDPESCPGVTGHGHFRIRTSRVVENGANQLYLGVIVDGRLQSSLSGHCLH